MVPIQVRYDYGPVDKTGLNELIAKAGRRHRPERDSPQDPALIGKPVQSVLLA